MPPAVLLSCEEILDLFRHPEAEIEESVAVDVDAPQAITTRQAETQRTTRCFLRHGVSSAVSRHTPHPGVWQRMGLEEQHPAEVVKHPSLVSSSRLMSVRPHSSASSATGELP